MLYCINELRNKGNGKVYILVTSRQEPDIDNKLNKLPTITMNIEDQFGADIKLFIEASLHKDEKLA